LIVAGYDSGMQQTTIGFAKKQLGFSMSWGSLLKKSIQLVQ